MTLNSIVCRLTLAMLSTILASELFAMRSYDNSDEDSKKKPRPHHSVGSNQKLSAARLKTIKRRAANGDLHAKNLLGYLYETGIGVPRDYKTAYNHYKDASDNGYKVSTFNVGRFYDYGWFVDQNTDEAIEYYKNAMEGDQAHQQHMKEIAEVSIPEVQYSMGRIYENGYGVNVDLSEARRFYELSSKKFYPLAFTSLGLIYEYGKGVEINLVEAAGYYQLGASLSEPTAQCNLGLLYETGGGGVQKSVEYAKQLYMAAAEQGNASAEFCLGDMYRTGALGYVDNEMALEYYSSAGDKGHAEAIHNLGYIHECVYGTKKDYKEALKYYQQAADLGNALSYIAVGSMYHQGLGIRKNLAKANANYTKAMEIDSEKIIATLQSGDADDQYSLAYIYQNGLGIKSNIRKAHELYKLAADKGHKEAQEALAEIDSKKLPTDIFAEFSIPESATHIQNLDNNSETEELN